jgi:hypothetical protein
LIKVLSSQVGITVGGKYLKDTIVNGEEGDIEGSSAEIENEDVGLPTRLVHTVGDGGGGGFVDDTFDLESGDGTGILGGLALSIVEVGWWGAV